MAAHYMRNLTRVLVGAALCAALLASAATPVPEDLPAVALGQAGLYRLQVTLLVFYGCLLLITPAFSGLIGGRLPIEISARGARFAEETEQSAELADARIDELEKATDALAGELITAHNEIKQLGKGTVEDNAQQEVDSKR
jgi:hypothetical protein